MTTAPQSGQAAARLLSASEVRKLSAGDTFKGVYVVNAITRKLGKNGRPYWEMNVSDQSGIIAAKIWSDASWWDRSTAELESRPTTIAEEEIDSLKGKSVGVNGKTTDFKGQLQFNFNAISLLDQDRFPPARYVPSSDIPLQVLVQRFEDLRDGCRDEIKDLLKHIFDGERWTKFRDMPAAVANHHAYANGLLEHTVTSAECAKAIALQYRSVYPTIDVDIVVAGALLHDLGKIDSYVMSPVPEVTAEGAVLDHIAIGYAMFDRLSDEVGLSRKTKDHLAHIILSHHGQKEFGSPVLPATAEALIVSCSDELDFRLFCWKDSIKDIHGAPGISAYHFAAQRRFWRTDDADVSGN